ncbi:MAG: asparagine synthase (glutamine-hydrolyzing) [Candidatus Omnitrophica bacterium]|nr:asparagine synthase (glutamine-hydrolyzing) [Candidatus Omnitrophota bacterium]
MCGICGYIHLDKSKKPQESILKGMMDTLVHRGPDDEGAYLSANVALGHRRLSIIDLETGHQPMTNEDGTVVIVYNGEVYNFKELKDILLKRGHLFKTRSDTEVVVHAYEEYGEDCVKLFNGMFAFAIWDAKNEKLFLARDRFGKKPLYYAIFDNQFIFGSELKAILKHPSVRKEIDLNALSKYLAYEYIPSPYSIFKNIRKLEPGSRLTLENGSYRVGRYWDLGFSHPDKFDLIESESKLTALLKESVKRRLISDVPLGVFLSGGVDSSSVVSMMAELMDPKEIKTFSIGFKERSYNELSDARRVADYFGTDHHEEILNPTTMLEIFPTILDVLDEPFADSSIIPTYLVSKFTRKYVKVALGGDGGDELFLGYPSFLAHVLDNYTNMIPNILRKIPLKILTRAFSPSYKYMSLQFKGARFLKGLYFPESIRHQAWIGSLIPQEQKKLFLSNLKINYDPLNVYDITDKLYEKVSKADSLDRALYLYVKTYMTDDILTKVDRASMANSLEVRAPFLDAEFAEFATSIPSSFKLKNLKTKWILKDSLKNKLPKETLTKRKQGFAVPIGKWLKEDLKHLLFEAFDRRKIEREGLFNYNYIKELLDQYLQNKNDTRKEIWDLFMFEMWYERWMR